MRETTSSCMINVNQKRRKRRREAHLPIHLPLLHPHQAAVLLPLLLRRRLLPHQKAVTKGAKGHHRGQETLRIGISKKRVRQAAPNLGVGKEVRSNNEWNKIELEIFTFLRVANS